MSAIKPDRLGTLSINPFSVICSFVDDQTLSRLSVTCRGMNLAVRDQFPIQWVRYIARHTPAPTRPIEELRGELRDLRVKTHATMSEIQDPPAGNQWQLVQWNSQFCVGPKPELITCRGMVDGIYQGRGAEHSSNEGFVRRYHAFLTRLNVDMEEIQKLLKANDDPHFFEEISRCCTQLVRSMKTFAVQETVALQFDEIVQKTEIRSNIPQAMHAQQQRNAAVLGLQSSAAFLAFAKDNRSATVTSFLGAEERLVFSDMERDRHLRVFWSKIFQFQFDHPTLTANQIRAYLDKPENAARIGAITELTLSDLQELPPEIRKFPNVRRLTIVGTNQGRLRVFPETLTHLNSLEALGLENHDFPEFPEGLLRIPNLTSYSLRGNQTPITVLPEEAASDRFLGGFGSLVLDVFATVEKVGRSIMSYFEDIEPGYLTANHCYGHLPREQFTEIPFNLWFRENFSIPPLPLIVVVALALVISGVVRSIGNCLLGCFPFLRDPGCVIQTLLIFILAPLLCVGGIGMLALTLSAAILNLPLLLLNVLINRVIGPYIVFPLRDYLGYDRMMPVNQA